MEHPTPAGASFHTGVEDPPTTVEEDVLDNVEPIISPGDEVTRNWNTGVS